MIKLEGFDENGNLQFKQCTTHQYNDLPIKGLSRSLDGVELNEPVIIPKSCVLNFFEWKQFSREIERMAKQLNADIFYIALPPSSHDKSEKIQVWFSKPDNKKLIEEGKKFFETLV